MQSWMLASWQADLMDLRSSWFKVNLKRSAREYVVGQALRVG